MDRELEVTQDRPPNLPKHHTSDTISPMKSIHTYLHCMGIALSVLIISVPLMHVQAYQLPESTDTELPTLFPAPGEEGLPILPQQTMDLPAVTDIVWASILQTAQKDNEIADLLNNVPVLLSGILEIHGKDHLYLGIERAYHNEHGSKHIEETLKKRFPGVPIYIEASDGVQTQAAKQKETTTIFSENFENGLTKWTALAFFSDGWQAHDDSDDNTIAQAQSCAWGCVLATKQAINLANYEQVIITFERWTNDATISVRINNETIKQYQDDSTKKTETITIDNTDNARISFIATGDTAAVDNITITGTREQEESIDITQLTASTTTPTTGSTITLTATITNTRNIATTTKTLQFYRHENTTNNPTTGGTRLSSSTTGTLNPNESTTQTITTIVPTVAETTRYYYYACIDATCSEPATIQVQPQEPETPEDTTITITSITATPTNPESGTPVTIQFTVRNNSATTLNPKTVHVYQHRSPPTNPTTGTRIAQTANTGTLNPNESTTKTITTIAPTVTETTRYYYYACINDTCSEPATIQVQPETPEDTTITITNVTATPTNTGSGTRGTMRFTVRNNGATALNPKIVRIYQHRSPTNNPTTGSRIAQTANTGTLNPNESTTKTITMIAPTVTKAMRYYYYACIYDTCSEPATIQVHPTTVLTISIISAEPGVSEHNNNTFVSIHFVIQNTGSRDNFGYKEVKFYRHTSPTTNPTSDGTEVASIIIGFLGSGNKIEKSFGIDGDLPAGIVRTTYYYYICIEKNCSDYAILQLYDENDVNPPYEDCFGVPGQTVPMGGDIMLSRPINKNNAISCGTLTLGGLETTDGRKGVVVSRHVIDLTAIVSSQPYTNIVVGHGQFYKNKDIGHLLGKILATPAPDGTVGVDAVFVEYPKPSTAGCSVTWEYRNESFCLGHGVGGYIDRASPLTIRGKDSKIYTVVGSQQPDKGTEMWMSGALSGVLEGYSATGDKMLVNLAGGSAFLYTASLREFSRDGDSGSPLYTIPDKDGNVRVVGIHTGRTKVAGNWQSIFSSWKDVSDVLKLKPLN